MDRAVCIIIIFLNNCHYDVKLTFVCATDLTNLNPINNLLAKLQNFVRDVRGYVNIKTTFDKERDRLKNNKFIKVVETGLKNAKPVKQVRVYSNPLPKRTEAIRKPVKIKFGLNAAQMIASHGYSAETHTVITGDGYILTTERILPDSEVPSNQTVVLHHGLLGSAEDWLLLGPGLALPYLLSDRGYDVWLLNARGNKHSRAHATNRESFNFWDFSWHEMGLYDLPATLTYIGNYTNNTNLYYIGHSMGATALLVLLSTRPEYNEKLKSAFLLAPLAFMYHVKGPLKYLSEHHSSMKISSLQRGNSFLVNRTFPETITAQFCRGNRWTCSNPLLLLSNGGKNISDPNLMDTILAHVPSGGSAKTLIHYLQLIRSGRFQLFNYGSKANLKKYRRKFPPKYNLKSINLPISVFSSSSDWLSSTTDIVTLLSKLGNVKFDHIVGKHDFSHTDFVFSKDAPELVYYQLMYGLDMIASPRNPGDKLVTAIL